MNKLAKTEKIKKPENKNPLFPMVFTCWCGAGVAQLIRNQAARKFIKNKEETLDFQGFFIFLLTN
jgi:hypothetical protein